MRFLGRFAGVAGGAACFPFSGRAGISMLGGGVSGSERGVSFLPKGRDSLRITVFRIGITSEELKGLYTQQRRSAGEKLVWRGYADTSW